MEQLLAGGSRRERHGLHFEPLSPTQRTRCVARPQAPHRRRSPRAACSGRSASDAGTNSLSTSSSSQMRIVGATAARRQPCHRQPPLAAEQLSVCAVSDSRCRARKKGGLESRPPWRCRARGRSTLEWRAAAPALPGRSTLQQLPARQKTKAAPFGSLIRYRAAPCSVRSTFRSACRAEFQGFRRSSILSSDGVGPLVTAATVFRPFPHYDSTVAFHWFERAVLSAFSIA